MGGGVEEGVPIVLGSTLEAVVNVSLGFFVTGRGRSLERKCMRDKWSECSNVYVVVERHCKEVRRQKVLQLQSHLAQNRDQALCT